MIQYVDSITFFSKLISQLEWSDCPG